MVHTHALILVSEASTSSLVSVILLANSMLRIQETPWMAQHVRIISEQARTVVQLTLQQNSSIEHYVTLAVGFALLTRATEHC